MKRHISTLAAAAAFALAGLFGLAFAAPAGADNSIETIGFTVSTEDSLLVSAYENGIATTAYLECMYQSGNNPSSNVFYDCYWLLDTDAQTAYAVINVYYHAGDGMLAEFFNNTNPNTFYQFQPY